ncbi:CubicO group peptidase, beta-lactamase class C family [Butyrivibrio hungatei DSM 14810]|uniref:CubicO group peptidase, beta-lactamase class C family n=1 Tax=Butyrivibrio hungatei DSM 14810 TaxID=1121132 RepID=A0A1M7T4Q6_9FIRM|nr:serine hydrolase [Butyrivibrio hungatei]SHN65662.1 CubicO group peptidase, beta-lactamase class C family [Butyrivibrio hungatei DSM 14810]
MNIRKLKYLDELIEAQRERNKLQGATIVVEHKGKRVYENHYEPDREDSIYKIFSMTKPITALAAMMLYERGKLDLMSNVSDYLPAFADCKVVTPDGIQKAQNSIKIINLLNMTSGIAGSGDFGEAERSMSKVFKEAKIQRESGILKNNIDVCNKLAEGYLAFEPGTGYKYGYSADIMAGVIEAITDMKYSEFLRKEIFDPLNMDDTGFKIDMGKTSRQAILYRRDKNNKVVRAEVDVARRMDMENPFEDPWFERGGAGLYSTASDYSHFTQMILNKGSYHGKELIGKKTLSYMLSPQLNALQLEDFAIDENQGYNYGNYFRVLTDPAKALSNGSTGEIGWGGFGGTYFFVDPSEELTVIYMQQIEGGYDSSFIRGVRQIVYGAI